MEDAAVRDTPDGAAQSTVPRPTGTTLWTMQVLRGAAALMVVIGHSQSTVARLTGEWGGSFERWDPLPWGASVDLFFVISGFIMVYASDRLFGRPDARRRFLRRRLVRIVPLYWLVTTLFLLLLGAATLKGGDPFPGPGAILSSYLFWPFDTRGDGGLFPVYDLGWTLNYEMLFYLLFAGVVVLARRPALVTLGAIMVALVLIGTVVPREAGAPWFATRPIVLDFGLGLAVGAMVLAKVRIAPAARALLAVGGLLLLAADPGHVFDVGPGVTVANEWPRVLLAGLPAAAILAAGTLGPEPPMPAFARPFTAIGDASYSLYLLHPFSLILLEKLAQKLPAVRAAPGGLLVAAAVALAIAIAIVGFRRVERPTTDWLNDRLNRRTAPRAAPVRELGAS